MICMTIIWKEDFYRITVFFLNTIAAETKRFNVLVETTFLRISKAIKFFFFYTHVITITLSIVIVTMAFVCVTMVFSVTGHFQKRKYDDRAKMAEFHREIAEFIQNFPPAAYVFLLKRTNDG